MAGRKSRSKKKSNTIALAPRDEPEKETIVEGEDLDGFTSALRLANASALPMALQAAVELGVFDLLAEVGEPGLSLTHIGERLRLCNRDALDKLTRLIRFLAFYDLFHVSDDVYSLNHVSKFFARNSDGVSLAPLLRLNNDKVFLESWFGLKDAILEEGDPFEKSHGMNVFDYLGHDGRFSQNVKTLVDVGGGIGITLSLITSRYPSIKGINFDLPCVIQNAPPLPGVEHVAGNMFESVPKGDAILLKGILRDWTDEQCLKLLKHCYGALPEKGKVIIVEQIVALYCNPLDIWQQQLSNDVLTMTLNPGGKERNQTELFKLIQEAGFPSFSILAAPYNHRILELHKTSPEAFV